MIYTVEANIGLNFQEGTETQRGGEICTYSTYRVERPRTQTLVCSFLHKFSVTSTVPSKSFQIYLGPRSDREDKLSQLLLVQDVYLWIMKVTQQFTEAIMTLTWGILGFSMISHAFCCPVLKSKVEKISYIRWKCAANVKLSQDRLQSSFQKIPY